MKNPLNLVFYYLHCLRDPSHSLRMTTQNYLNSFFSLTAQVLSQVLRYQQNHLLIHHKQFYFHYHYIFVQGIINLLTLYFL